MRKLLLSAVLGLLGMSANAQNYTPRITHTSGTAVYNTASPIIPISVTVSQVNGTPTSTPLACGTGPYYLAPTGATKGGYRFDFSPAVTHVKFEISELQGDDTLYIRVNNGTPGVGPITPITASMIDNYVTTCTSPPPTIPSNWAISKGRLTSTLNAGNNGVTLTYASSPGYITSIELVHPHDSATSSGVVVSAYAALDTCKQPFNVTADSPYCSGRTLKLHATDFPGSSHLWTTTSSISIPTGQDVIANPTILGLAYPASSGWYIDTVTRGICGYRDSVYVDVDLKPSLPNMSYKGPKCAGDNDTITVNSSANTAIYLLKPGATQAIKAPPPFFNQFEITNIQLPDAGTYKGFAITAKGCVSDTTTLVVSLNSLVKANFSVTTKLGCTNDTVEFTDESLGNNSWKWDFADGNFQAGNDPLKDGNPIHIYNSQGTYLVKLLVSNNSCSDSVTKPVVLNHPLIVDFEMDNNLGLKDDSICQGDTIFFQNLSSATPNTSPLFDWDFKDGSLIDHQFQPNHKFLYYGVYPVTLTVTDYLGCKKSKSEILVVDSLGSASFFTDTVLCTGETIAFSGDYSTIGGTYALWNFGDGHTIQDEFKIQHAFDKPGTYDVQLEAHYRICKDTTYHQNIYVNAYPVVDLGPDTAICPNGDPVALADLVNLPTTPGLKWRWNTETKDTTASIIAHHPGSYSVTVDNQGCTTADTIVVKKNCYVDIPNVFTPNGDGYNDYFLPRQLLSRNVTKFSMSIYNRWGAVVFETNSINGRGWDGKMNDKDQPEGVYVYLIKVSFGNNTNENYQGNITLLR